MGIRFRSAGIGRIVAKCASLFAAAALVAFAGAAPFSSAAAPGRPHIALVMKTLTSPFFLQMEQGARRAEAEFGIELLVKTSKLLVKTSSQETSVEQQITIIDQLTRAKVDAIVIAPADSYRLVRVLKKAQDAGIPIVNVDNRLAPEAMQRAGLRGVPFISIDNRAAAYAVAKHLAVGARAPTEAAIIEGFPGADNSEERKQGALSAFSENPNITVVGVEAANWKIDDAYEVARKLFSAHPRIGLLYCANDMMALGAIRYLKDAGIGPVSVAGHDALEEVRNAMRKGELTASVDQQAARQGYLGVAYAVRLLRGEALPAETMLKATVVTAQSLGRRGK